MKRFIVLLLVCLMCFTLVSCNSSSYEEAETDQKDYFSGYLTVVKEWHSPGGATYRIMYANDTKVMYLMFDEGYTGGITPLYNADGTLQVYEIDLVEVDNET